MVTKISEWSRIQDSFRIILKIESLVDFAIPNMPSKFRKDPSVTFWVILLTHRQTNKVWQKHYLLGGGNYWNHDDNENDESETSEWLRCRKLLDSANDWLRKNTDLQVRSCETITWMSHDVKALSSGSSELMTLSKRVAERVQTFNVRGLRSVQFLRCVPRERIETNRIRICDSSMPISGLKLKILLKFYFNKYHYLLK